MTKEDAIKTAKKLAEPTGHTYYVLSVPGYYPRYRVTLAYSMNCVTICHPDGTVYQM